MKRSVSQSSLTSMERWIGKVALVTGASSGIGAAIATSFVGSGLQVVGLARRMNRLEALAADLKEAKGKLYPIKCDLRNETDILKAFEWTIKELGGVDVLVNNAGVALPTSIVDGPTEDYRQILDINLLAVAICTREAIKSMRARDSEGHIIYINSELGYNPRLVKTPISLYQASKFGMRGLIETVALEIQLAKDKIKTTNIIPGLVKTEIFRAAGATDSFYELLPYIEPRDIADGALFALSARPNVQIDDIKITPVRHKL